MGNEIKYKKMTKKPSFENIQHTEVVKESKSLNIPTEGGFLTFYLYKAFPRISCCRVYHLWQNEWLFW